MRNAESLYERMQSPTCMCSYYYSLVSLVREGTLVRTVVLRAAHLGQGQVGELTEALHQLTEGADVKFR